MQSEKKNIKDKFSNQTTARFIILFLAIFAAFQLLWFLSAKTIEPYISEILHVRLICHIISLLTPSVSVAPEGINIISSNFSLSVDSACNGLDVILLVVSAIIAFRSDFTQKIVGAISGCLLFYLFNIVRITILFYSKAFAPDLFDFLHIYAGQTLAIIAGTAYFFMWASWVSPENRNNSNSKSRIH